MPLKLVDPRPGRWANYRVRGTHRGVYIDRTTGTAVKATAQAELRRVRDEIERGSYRRREDPTFASAAMSYLDAGGEDRFVSALNDHFGDTPLADIDQAAIDAAAAAIYPEGTPATRNRQVYSPMSAILKHAGVEKALKRPKGGRGAVRLHWLRKEEADRLLDAADALHARFGPLCVFLLATGCRLQEALNLMPADLHLSESFAYVRKTKNGHPRPVHLPPAAVAALANLEIENGRTVFRLTKSGYLYGLLSAAAEAAHVTIPAGISFHIFRHSYGAWMRRYAGADTSGLVATGAWRSRQSAAVYEHVDVSEEARRADLLPIRAKSVRS